LPQSPQQLKQLLMVAGFEKYYQIARCFRDEDTRADRQPEFTQLDLEMSFVDEEDILGLLEELFTSLIETVTPAIRLIKPFPRMTYAEVMDRYGTDKPDTRFGLEIKDISAILSDSEFTVFKSAIQNKGAVEVSPARLHNYRINRSRSGGLPGTVGKRTHHHSLDNGDSQPASITAGGENQSVAARAVIRQLPVWLPSMPSGDLLIMGDRPGRGHDELRREMGKRLNLRRISCHFVI
jgi:aspartyl-tRNA synthetase